MKIKAPKGYHFMKGKNGKMSLRETADRLGVSFVRVKQIQDKAVEKLTGKIDF